MKKIILAAAVAMVAGAPLASATAIGNMNTGEPGSRHCTYQGEKYDLCREDRHKNGGGNPNDSGGGAASGHRR